MFPPGVADGAIQSQQIHPREKPRPPPLSAEADNGVAATLKIKTGLKGVPPACEEDSKGSNISQ